MPRHEPVSPEEDLAAFYDGTPPGGPVPAAVSASVPGATPPGVPGATVSPPADPSASPAWPADGFEPDPNAEPSAQTPRLAPVSRPPPTFPSAAPVVADAPNPVVAALISALLPGVGQIYAGQTTKGVVLLLVALFTCYGGGLFSVLAAVDAALIAQRKGRGEPVGDWQFF